MPKILKAKISDAKLLSKLSVTSFLPAHGHSASKEDIKNYMTESFSQEVFKKELVKTDILYYLIYHQNKIAGYSKIVLNDSCDSIESKNIAYMSRLYLLKEFYGIGLGKELMNFNINLIKKHSQKGIWLKVWFENAKAINFYQKTGFKIVGRSDFRISESHSNPNHIMYLEF